MFHIIEEGTEHIPRELIISLLATAAEIYFYHTYIDIQIPHIESPLTELFLKYSLTVASAIITFFFSLGLTTMYSKGLFKHILHVQRMGGKARKAIHSVFEARVEQFMDIIQKIQTEEGADVDDDFASKFAKFCFKKGRTYTGVDTHVPSKYLKIQREYLEAHAELQKKLKAKRSKQLNTRILIVDHEELLADFRYQPEEFDEFIKWHIHNKVNLKVTDKPTADACRVDNNLRSIEIAIWYDWYSLQWTRKKPDNINLSLSFAGNEQYNNAVNYVESLIKKGKAIIDGGDPIGIPELENEAKELEILEPLEKRLGENWDWFVDCKRRLTREEAFLESILRVFSNENRENIYILDAAAGIGCEAIYLAKKGYNVTANEIDKNLYGVGYKEAEKAQLENKIKWTFVNWMNIAERFDNKKFDLIFVLGNSICLVKKETNRRRCLEQFFKILKPNGLLVVDQRNFNMILQLGHRCCQLNEFYKPSAYRADCMYCGSKIKGWPTKVNDDLVTFAYGPSETDIWQEISMYPLKNNELVKTLNQVGFGKIEIYSDFVKSNPPYEDCANFYTFVARKPLQ